MIASRSNVVRCRHSAIQGGSTIPCSTGDPAFITGAMFFLDQLLDLLFHAVLCFASRDSPAPMPRSAALPWTRHPVVPDSDFAVQGCDVVVLRLFC
jgi:hypothetical protein